MAVHCDLDLLNSDEDRSVFRLRVMKEYAQMKSDALKNEAEILSGIKVKNRIEAVRIIANHQIKNITGKKF